MISRSSSRISVIGSLPSLFVTIAFGILSTTLSAPQVAHSAGITVNLVQGSSGMVWMPILVARQMKYFEAEGLDVNYVIAGGGAKAAQTLVTGAAEFAATTMTDAINARRQGADVRVIAPLHRQYPTDCVIRTDIAKRLGIVSTSPVMDRIKAMRNLKIGLGGQGSPADQLVIWLAKKGGLDPSRDVQRISLGAEQAVMAAFQNGAIDAFCYGPPASTHAVMSGNGMFLFHIVGGPDLPEISRFPNAVLVTSERYMKAHPDIVERVARGYVRAISFMQGDPQKVSSAIKPLFSTMESAIFDSSFTSARAGFPSNPTLESKDVQAVIDFAKETTGSRINVTPAELVDNAWVTKASAAIERQK